MKKILVVLLLISILIWLMSGFVSYMVSSWKSNADSKAETNHYNEIQELKKINNTDTNTKETSFIWNVIINFFVGKTYADDNNQYHTLELSPQIMQLLEKYYILSKLDMTKIPTDIFVYWKNNWEEMPMILNSYDYLNKTSTLADFIRLTKEFKGKTLYKETIRQELKDIIDNYFKNKKIVNNIPFFPQDIVNDKWYQFVIDWLKNHKFLVPVSKQIWEKLKFDYRLTLAAILTEQFRYNWTYRGIIKKYMKNTPFIFSMTKWSYWIWWIKEFTWNKIMEDSQIYDNYNKVFEGLSSDEYKDMSTKNLLQTKYWEVVYPNVLISNIINRWNKAWYSIEDKPWIILTLYNFGNSSNKKPHKDPKIWWAVIKLNENKNREYTFWWLWEALYYYIKIYWLYK